MECARPEPLINAADVRLTLFPSDYAQISSAFILVLTVARIYVHSTNNELFHFLICSSLILGIIMQVQFSCREEVGGGVCGLITN